MSRDSPGRQESSTRRSTLKAFVGALGFVVAWSLVRAQVPTPNVESLQSPAGRESSVPQRTVQGDRALLSWVEEDGAEPTLKFAEHTTAGWSDALTVVATNHLMINSSDVPSVLALPDGSFAAHWMEENGDDPEAYDLKVAWSVDGRSWSTPVKPNRDKT